MRFPASPGFMVMLSLVLVGAQAAIAEDRAVSTDVAIHLHLERQPPPMVLVWADGLTEWTAERIQIDQKNRAFLPELAVCPPGGTVAITNNDDQQHNVFALDQRLGVDRDLGLGQPGSVLELPVTWPANEVVRAGCKIHPQMRLWIAAVTTRCFVTVPWPRDQRELAVTLTHVPGSVTAVRIWSPRTAPVVVVIGENAPLLVKGMVAGSATVARLPSPGEDRRTVK